MLASAFPWLRKRLCSCRSYFSEQGARLDTVMDRAALVTCPTFVSRCLFPALTSHSLVQISTPNLGLQG